MGGSWTRLRTPLAALLLVPAALAAEPMDLSRTDARWVRVQVVTTPPHERPRRLSEPAPGWLEVGPAPGQRTVRVPGRWVERAFLAHRSPVPDSFSDYVWVFDAGTGHVLSAALAGRVEEPVRLGFLRTSVEVSLLTVLSTRTPGGYGAPRQLAGRTVVDYCRDPDRPDCTRAPSATYDPSTGRVRAHGGLCAVWGSLRALAYTRLGEARFLEVGDPERARRDPPRERRPPADAARGHAC